MSLPRPVSELLRHSHILEVSGEAGTGKSQLAMLLAIQTLIADVQARVVFLCTESRFTVQRFRQLLETHGVSSQDSCLHRLFTQHIDSVSALERVLLTDLNAFVNRTSKVGLLVLDSIAAPLRGDAEFLALSAAERRAVILRLGNALRNFAISNHSPVIVINQVSDVIEQVENIFSYSSDCVSVGTDGSIQFSTSGRLVRPALGLVWAEFPSNRIFLVFSKNRKKRQIICPRSLQGEPLIFEYSLSNHSSALLSQSE